MTFEEIQALKEEYSNSNKLLKEYQKAEERLTQVFDFCNENIIPNDIFKITFEREEQHDQLNEHILSCLSFDYDMFYSLMYEQEDEDDELEDQLEEYGNSNKLLEEYQKAEERLKQVFDFRDENIIPNDIFKITFERAEQHDQLNEDILSCLSFDYDTFYSLMYEQEEKNSELEDQLKDIIGVSEI